MIPAANIHVHVPVLDNERMLQQFLILGSIFVILQKAVVDKGAKVVREALIQWQTGRIVLDDLRQYFKLRLAVFVGEGAGGELYQRDAQTPNIRADVVIWFVRVRRIYSLGRHVGGTPCASRPSFGVNKAT